MNHTDYEYWYTKANDLAEVNEKLVKIVEIAKTVLKGYDDRYLARQALQQIEIIENG